jgi:ganglioside-induced differentiation-associated protein 1
MIELYHHGSSVCAAKVRFTLGEKGLAWQGHYLDILRGDQFAPDILSRRNRRPGPMTQRIETED